MCWCFQIIMCRVQKGQSKTSCLSCYGTGICCLFVQLSRWLGGAEVELSQATEEKAFAEHERMICARLPLLVETWRPCHDALWRCTCDKCETRWGKWIWRAAQSSVGQFQRRPLVRAKTIQKLHRQAVFHKCMGYIPNNEREKVIGWNIFRLVCLNPYVKWCHHVWMNMKHVGNTIRSCVLIHIAKTIPFYSLKDWESEWVCFVLC